MTTRTDRAALERAIEAAGHWSFTTAESAEALTRLRAAARAHLDTLPRIKTVTRWRVQYAFRVGDGWLPNALTCESQSAAEVAAAELNRDDHYACIEVVPFEHKIPEA